jgi:hypothetical protein
MRGPIKINGDGLIVFFEVGSSDPPEPTLHLRCASDLTCQIFVRASMHKVPAPSRSQGMPASYVSQENAIPSLAAPP